MPRSLPAKDRLVATQIETIYETDDTLGARSLAPLLKMGKARVGRVMREFSIEARPRKKRYNYPGKSPVVYPNLLRVEDAAILDCLVVYSDIFTFSLADGTHLYGCFALLRKTRQVLSLCFDYAMKSDLVSATINQIDFLDVANCLWHTDQGSQFGPFETLLALVEKGFILSMSRALPSDS
jgi:transposase InsO family protein